MITLIPAGGPWAELIAYLTALRRYLTLLGFTSRPLT